MTKKVIPFGPTPIWVYEYNNVPKLKTMIDAGSPIYTTKKDNSTLFEKEFPNLSKEFKKIQNEQYELFACKMISYGLSNIALGTNLETESEKNMSLTSIFIRCWDKINRLKNLLSGTKNTIKDESIEDTWKDLSVYGIIAQLVTNGKWKK